MFKRCFKRILANQIIINLLYIINNLWQNRKIPATLKVAPFAGFV